jgi:hypothetical protein
VGFGDVRAVARTAPEISAVPDLHRRFQQWVRESQLEGILRVLAEELHARGKLELEGAFIDAFTGPKKGARGRAQQARQGDENHRSLR